MKKIIILTLTIFLVLSCNSPVNEPTVDVDVVVTTPIFRTIESSRSIFMTKEQNDTNQFWLYIPPIIGWSETTLGDSQTTIDFEFFDTTLTCDIDISDTSVIYSGSNSDVSITMEISNDGTYTYNSVMISERLNNNPDVSYFSIFEVQSDGSMTDNFVDGDSSMWCFTASPSDSIEVGSLQDGSYIYLTYDLDETDTGISQFNILTFDEEADSSYYVDPTTLSIATWNKDTVESFIDLDNLTSMPMTLSLQDDNSWQ